MSKEQFAQVKSAFQQALSQTADGPFGQISGLWKTFLENRDNFPTYEQFAVGFHPQANFAAGIGMGIERLSGADYERQFQVWVQRVSDLFTPEELSAWPEPLVGSPSIVTWQGYRASVLYIKNFSQVHLIQKLLRAHARRGSGLKVLEIGAGYGGVAEILLRTGIAACYTIVDLPHNLFLSAQYLRHTHPDRDAVVCNRAEPSSFTQADMRFVFPNDIAFLKDDFDLVINTASLGEMPAATAQAYVDWVSRHLSDGGLFISHNADRVRGAADVIQRQSDYGFDKFKLVGVYPNQPTGGPLHTQHVVVVLARAEEMSRTFNWRRLDHLSGVLNLGVDREGKRTCAFVMTPDWDATQVFFDILDRFYRASTFEEKYLIASGRTGDGDCDLILEMVQGGVAFLLNRDLAYDHFLKYLATGLSPMAIALAVTVVRLWDRRRLTAAEERVVFAALERVPPYVREQMDGLKLAAAQARFASYLTLP